MYLFHEVMVITCLRDPKEFNGFQNQDLNSKFSSLYSVDRLSQSVIFENLLESNQTLLPKANLFIRTCSTRMKI
jgi:hypothetical protein